MVAIIFNIVLAIACGIAMINVFAIGAGMMFLSAAMLAALAIWYRESLDLCASLMKVINICQFHF